MIVFCNIFYVNVLRLAWLEFHCHGHIANSYFSGKQNSSQQNYELYYHIWVLFVLLSCTDDISNFSYTKVASTLKGAESFVEFK